MILANEGALTRAYQYYVTLCLSVPCTKQFRVAPVVTVQWFVCLSVTMTTSQGNGFGTQSIADPPVYCHCKCSWYLTYMWYISTPMLLWIKVRTLIVVSFSMNTFRSFTEKNLCLDPMSNVYISWHLTLSDTTLSILVILVQIFKTEKKKKI